MSARAGDAKPWKCHRRDNPPARTARSDTRKGNDRAELSRTHRGRDLNTRVQQEHRRSEEGDVRLPSSPCQPIGETGTVMLPCPTRKICSFKLLYRKGICPRTFNGSFCTSAATFLSIMSISQFGVAMCRRRWKVYRLLRLFAERALEN